MKLIPVLLAASILQLAALALAHAQVSGHTSISNIGITLIDLAPDDGIAPSYTYSEHSPGEWDKASTQIRYGARHDLTTGTLNSSGRLPWANQQLEFDSAALPDYHGARLAGANRVAGDSLETLELSASASAQGAGTSWIESYAYSNVYNLLLAPRTSVRLTFDVGLGSTVDPAASVWDNGRGSSLAVIDFSAPLNTGGLWDYSEPRHTIDGPWTFGEAGLQTITIDFANIHDTEVVTYLRLGVIASARAPINPVPEPSSYAMLAAGLGMVGLLGRRRARKPTVAAIA